VIRLCSGGKPAKDCPMNVLQNVHPLDIKMKPYPYLVKEGALPSWIYERLEAQFPKDDVIVDIKLNGRKVAVQNNFRVDISMKQILGAESRLPPLWVAFSKFHSSRPFYEEVLRVFEQAIQTQRPEVVKSKNKTLSEMNLDIRFMETPEADLNIDCQMGINTPVKSMGTVRGLHHDVMIEIFAGLLYMRHEGDTSRGGKFQVWNCPAPCAKDMYKGPNKSSRMKLVEEVPYQRNTLAWFINSRTSIHAVSPRSVTPYSRRLVNFIGQTVVRKASPGASPDPSLSEEEDSATTLSATSASSSVEAPISNAKDPCPPLKPGHTILDSPVLGDEHLPYSGHEAIAKKLGVVYSPPPPGCSSPAPIASK